ncbi:hypothetical protein [Prochlorococcus marinus]|uniref:hypothetical protein n=1 Tax=Prochlorococcus marinus TaxID=1219 RepID=UPI0022B44E0C|nr:hypothetical protein [Prochlorococcus marinus]
MKNNKIDKNLEKVRINIYNVLAILIVIIPEYFAELIYSIEVSQHKTILPNEGDAWENDTELKLSKMNIYELRLMAKRLSIHGYSNENKNTLIRRINRKSKNRIKWKSLKIGNISKTL